MPDATKPDATAKPVPAKPVNTKPEAGDKAALNIQDNFLNAARKERIPVTIFLMGGVKLMGRIRSFDKYSVILESNHQEQLIFKHAISTVVLSRSPQSSGQTAEV
jgi:host factor-I protein